MKMATVFHAVLAWFSKVFTNTDWTHAAQTALNVSAPLVETAAQLLGGPAVELEVAGIINTVKSDFGVAVTTIAQIQAGATNVNIVALLRNTLEAIRTNLAQLLTAADVKDTNTKQVVTLTVNTITGEIEAILASVPKAA